MAESTRQREYQIQVQRTARWALLGVLSPATREVWVALHGYGESAGHFARSARWPEALERAFVFPEALSRFYNVPAGTQHTGASHREALVGASWMTREVREADIDDNLRYLDTLWELVRREAPNAQLNVLGFSQGTATATRWVAHRIAAGSAISKLIIWAGALPPDVELGATSPLRKIDVAIVVGSRDIHATPERVSAERARLDAARFPARFVAFEGGHRMDDATLRAVTDGTAAEVIGRGDSRSS